MISIESVQGKALIIIYVAFLVLGLALHRWKRVRGNMAGRFKQALVDNALAFDYVAVSSFTFFFGLNVLVDLMSEYIGVQYLITLERMFDSLRDVADILELEAWQISLVLLGIYALGVMGASRNATRKMSKFFRIYRSATETVFVLAVILCSFTLLSREIGYPDARIELQLQLMKKEYSDIDDLVYARLSGSVGNDILTTIAAEFPDDYVSAMRNLDEIYNQLDQHRSILSENYSSLKKEYTWDDPDIETLLAAALLYAAFQPSIIDVPPTGDGSTRGTTVDATTYGRLVNTRKVKNILNQAQQASPRDRITFLETESGRAFVARIPGLATEQIKIALFQPWIESFPLMEPLIDVFVDSVDEKLESDIRETAEKITKDALEKPRDTEKLIKAESKRLASSAARFVTDQHINRAAMVVSQLKTDLTMLEQMNSRLASQEVQLKENAVANWIEKLGSDSYDTLVQATTELRELSQDLSQQDVDTIVESMESAHASWETGSYRQGHCTYVTTTTAKYYIANLVLALDQEYVDEETRENARNAMDEGQTTKRYVDFGWI